MANPAWFDETFYLGSKLTQLQSIGYTEYTNVSQVKAAIEAAGMTTFQHFSLYSLAERTNPDAYFNTNEYLAAKAAQLNSLSYEGKTTWTADEVAVAFQNAGFTNAYEHFARFGWLENINPSNAFDVSLYLEAKAALTGLPVDQVIAAFVAAGFDPISHYMTVGYTEPGMAAFPVPVDEQVGVVGQEFILTTALDYIVGTAGNDTIYGSNDVEGTGDITFNVGDVIDGGAGVDTLIIASNADSLDLNGRTVFNVENFTVLNAYSGFDTLNLNGVAFETVTVNYDRTDMSDNLYIDRISADTDLVVENVTADGYDVYRNYDEDYSILPGSVSQNNTLRNIDYSLNDSYIEFYNYSYFTVATELNLTTTVENLITGGTSSTGNDEGVYLYNYIEMEAGNATINLTYNLTNVLQPGEYTYIWAGVYNVGGTDVVNVEFNIDNVDGLYVEIDTQYSGASSASDVATFNINGLANTDGYNYIYLDDFETINMTINGDAEFEAIYSYDYVSAAQTVNIVANANLTVVDVWDFADDQAVTINISGAGNVTFDMNGDNYGVTVNAAGATGNLDLGVGSDSGYATVVTAGSGDDIITLLNAFELNTAGDAFLQVLDGGAGYDTFEIDADDLQASQALLTVDVPDFSDAIINFERLSLTTVTDQIIDVTTLGFSDIVIDGYTTGGSLTVDDGAAVEITGNGTTDYAIIIDGDPGDLDLTVNGPGLDLNLLTVTNAETINLVSGSATGTNTVELLANDTVNLLVSGPTALDLTGSSFAAIETVAAGSFDAGLIIDVSASTEAVTITTGDGSDEVIGSDQNDIISVGNGGNTVTGGLGLDTIILGSGATSGDVDTVVYTSVADSQGTTVDVISGFQVNVQATDDAAFIINDKIDLSAVVSGAAFYSGEANGYGAVLTSLVGGGANSQAVFDITTSTLYIDIDASGTLDNNDMAIQLVGVTDLSDANFVFA